MTPHGSQYFKGILYAILSSSTFGFAPLFTLLLIGRGLSSFEVLAYRWGVAALALGLAALLSGRQLRIGRRDGGIICLLGIFRALTSLCLVIAYQYIATGVASSIHFLYPLATAIGMALFFHERLSWKTLVAILASLAGAVLLSANDFSSGGSDAMTGIVTACLSVLFYSSYMIGVRKTRAAQLDSTVLTFYVTLFGAVLFVCCGACTTGIRWGTDGPTSIPVPRRHRVGRFANLRPQGLLAVTDRNEQRNPFATRHAKQPAHPFLVEPSHHAGSQPQVSGLQAELIGRHADIQQAVLLVLQDAADRREQIGAFKHHDHEDRRFGGPTVHAAQHGATGHLRPQLRPVNHHEPPRLGIVGRRRQPRRLEALFQFLPFDGTVRIAADTLPATCQLRKIFHTTRFFILRRGENNRRTTTRPAPCVATPRVTRAAQKGRGGCFRTASAPISIPSMHFLTPDGQNPGSRAAWQLRSGPPPHRSAPPSSMPCAPAAGVRRAAYHWPRATAWPGWRH